MTRQHDKGKHRSALSTQQTRPNIIVQKKSRQVEKVTTSRKVNAETPTTTQLTGPPMLSLTWTLSPTLDQRPNITAWTSQIQVIRTEFTQYHHSTDTQHSIDVATVPKIP